MKTDLLKLVMDGMGWDKKKAQLWFNTPNLMFGGATPNGYELLKGTERLEEIIRNAIDENKQMKNNPIKYFSMLGKKGNPPIWSFSSEELNYFTDKNKFLKSKTLISWKWPYAGRGELLCPHGVGHGGIHGCDGCCGSPSFKKAWNRKLKRGEWRKRT